MKFFTALLPVAALFTFSTSVAFAQTSAATPAAPAATPAAAPAATSAKKPGRARATPTPISKTVTATKETEVVTPTGTQAVEATVTSEPLSGEAAAANAPTPTPTPSPTPTMKERAKGVVDSVGAGINSSNENRAASRFTLMLAYSPFDLILPSKIGGSVAVANSDLSSYEVEYLGANLSVPFIVKDLGGFSDRRISFFKRSFNGRNSLNFHYGLSYFETDVTVGNEYLARATNRPAHLDLIGVKALGVVWGVGNRWNFKHGFTAGVDWFSWAQPLIVIDEDRELLNYIDDDGVKNTLDDALDLTSYIPRLSFLKVQLGWSF